MWRGRRASRNGCTGRVRHGTRFGTTGPGRPFTSIEALAEEIAGLGSTVFSFGWHSGSGFSAESVADFGCVGPFVAARAAQYGADPDKVVVVGHSMGAEAGSMLAFSSFDLDAAPDCTETGGASDPIAFVGIAGAYGMVGGPLDDDHTRFRVRSYPQGTFEELDADEEILSASFRQRRVDATGQLSNPETAGHGVAACRDHAESGN